MNLFVLHDLVVLGSPVAGLMRMLRHRPKVNGTLVMKMSQMGQMSQMQMKLWMTLVTRMN
jgi:hypothetical protein